MKKTLLLICLSALFFVHESKGQTVAELKTTLSTTSQKVQALHHYPKNIKDGQCHNVEITSISLNGDMLTITETWSNWLSKKATTILNGKVEGNIVRGEWHSNYSSGTWSYDFSKGTGLWNKIKSTFDRFTDLQKLEFRIVNSKDIKDGFFDCQ